MRTSKATVQQRSRGLVEVIKPVYTGICYVHIAQILLVMILAVLGDINGTDPKVRQEDYRASSWPSHC